MPSGLVLGRVYLQKWALRGLAYREAPDRVRRQQMERSQESLDQVAVLVTELQSLNLTMNGLIGRGIKTEKS